MFKEDDRVHVKRLDGEEVDFYGTLKHVDRMTANLFDCTNKKYNYIAVFLPSDNSFGEDKEDYYVLAEDEEDTKGGNNMPTIKTKKEMNLPELIEWGWKNEFISSVFWTSNREEGFNHKALFDVDGNFYTSDNFNFNDTFTVEIEEPITEVMKFQHTVERFISSYVNEYRYATHDNKSIKDILNNRPPHVETTHIYAEVENELILIWTKEEGLME